MSSTFARRAYRRFADTTWKYCKRAPHAFELIERTRIAAEGGYTLGHTPQVLDPFAVGLSINGLQEHGAKVGFQPRASLKGVLYGVVLEVRTNLTVPFLGGLEDVAAVLPPLRVHRLVVD